MDITGFSEKTAEQLFDKLGVINASQLYTLTYDDLSKLDGFKDKKITGTLNSITNSKNTTLARFIFALGIDGVGKVAANDLAKKFKSIEAIKLADRETLVSMDNVGEITADGIIGWFADEQNSQELDALLLHVAPEYAEKTTTGGAFEGQLVVLTGTLPTYKRSQAQKLIEENGGECASSVTAKTTLVLAGEDAGSKLEKAKKLGVKIIDEVEFKQMLNL